MLFNKDAIKLAILALPTSFAYAQPTESVSNFDIPHLNKSIDVDGDIDETAWQNALAIPLNIVNHPWNNKKSPVSTTARIFENGEYVYISFEAQDPNPENILAFLGDRDSRWGDDLVGIKLDTYNTRRANYEFLINPLGVQHDSIVNVITGDVNDSWNAIWESNGKITDKGFQVEIAIPYRILNFEDNDAKKTWAIEFVRLYPRDSRLRISHMEIDRNDDCWLCQAPEITGFEKAKTGKNIMVTPAVVAQQNQTRDVYSSGAGWDKDSDVDAGVDLRWGINANTLFNATINPDFSTVESDSGQLSINKTFSLYYDEKRNFFLENTDYFDTIYDLVYTRNIADPDYGAKLTGKVGEQSYGVFATNDTQTNFLLPGNLGSDIASIDAESKSAALRYRYDVSEALSLGAISTLRSADDYHNYVFGLDTKYKFDESNTLLAQALFSQTQYPTELTDSLYGEQAIRANKQDEFDDHAVKVEYKHVSEDWQATLNHESVGEDFRADLGFIDKVDFKKNRAHLKRMFYGDNSSFWQDANIAGQYVIKHNQNNELISRELAVSAGFNGPMLSMFDIMLEQNEKVGLRHNGNSLAIDGNTDRFEEQLATFYARIRPLNTLELEAEFKIGDRIDYANNRLGDYQELYSNITWYATKHLQVDFYNTLAELDADGANVYQANLSELRLNYQFNVNSYLKLNLVYRDVDRNQANNPNVNSSEINKNLSTQLIYAYKLNPQTVFYLGYSDFSLQNDDIASLSRAEKTFFTKVSYAWMP